MCVDQSLRPYLSSNPLLPRYSFSRYLYINTLHIGTYRYAMGNLNKYNDSMTQWVKAKLEETAFTFFVPNRPDVLPSTLNIMLPLDVLSWWGTSVTTTLLSFVLALLAYTFSFEQTRVFSCFWTACSPIKFSFISDGQGVWSSIFALEYFVPGKKLSQWGSIVTNTVFLGDRKYMIKKYQSTNGPSPYTVMCFWEWLGLYPPSCWWQPTMEIWELVSSYLLMKKCHNLFMKS